MFLEMRWTVLVTLGVAVLLGLASCASPGVQVSLSNDQWLAEKGFGARRNWESTALHLGSQQMRSNSRISQLLRRVHGVRLQPGPGNPVGLSRTADDDRGSCVLQVFLNGVRLVSQDREARIDLDARVGIRELDGLELHVGAAGPVYDSDGCGSLLLWNRGLNPVEDPAFLGSIRASIEGEIPAEDVQVRLGASGPLQDIDSSGAFLFRGLLPGEYQLNFFVGGQLSALHLARVYADFESHLNVKISGGTSLAGR